MFGKVFRSRLVAAPLAFAGFAGWARAEEAPAFSPEQVGFFEEKIRPALAAKCYKCHSERSVKLKGGLYLDSREGLLKGGDSGEPSLLPGKPDESLFMLALRHEDEDLAMPPKEKLSKGVVEDFAKWIRMGAPFPAKAKEGEGAEASAEEPAWWETIDPDKLPSADKSVAEVVDRYVDARLAREKVKPAPPAPDQVLLRRLTLDLAGRSPTLAETEAFLGSEAADKVEKLVDRLLHSGSHARHMVNEFDWFLMGDKGGMRRYLAEAFEAGKPWDEIFRDVLLAKGDAKDDAKKELVKFLSNRVGDQDKLVNDVSIAFFGINVSCAQCHDHPEVPGWKQDHYYGMKSFLSRLYKNGDFLAERDHGLVGFKTTKGVEKKAKLMFLDGTIFDEPASEEPSKEEKEKLKKELAKLAKEKRPPPKPAFSRRAKLVEAGLGEAGRDFFSRAIVNRLWYRLFGRGLVAPIDQMHGANLPSHPELLLWLARDLREHDYDLRHTLRGLALSRAYARSGVWNAKGGGERPSPVLLAVREARPLTPEQYGSSLVLAASDPETFDLGKPEDFEKRMEQIENSGRGWNHYFPRPNEFFAIDVGEALFLSNNDRVARELLSSGGGKLVRRLGQTEGAPEQVELAFRAVLSRSPTDDERALFTDYLAAREDRSDAALGQVVWALLTSTEFRFNH